MGVLLQKKADAKERFRKVFNQILDQELPRFMVPQLEGLKNGENSVSETYEEIQKFVKQWVNKARF